MECLELPDFLLDKHLLHTRRCFDVSLLSPGIGQYNETRFKAVGSHKCINIYFTYEYY